MDRDNPVIVRAAFVLAHNYATRSEAVTKLKDVKTLRECQEAAGWMGIPREEFLRQVVDRTQFNTLRIDKQGIQTKSDWYELHRLLQKMLG